jgi:O-antigen/teichoic acid export membrane protein
MILASGRPGLVNLCGAGEWRKVADLRVEFHVLAIALGATVGAVILLVGGDFVRLWLGADYFAGEIVNVLMVAITIGLVLLRNETGVLDGMLKVRAKTNAMLISAAVTVGLGAVLTRSAGGPGMAVAVLIGETLAVIMCFSSVEADHAFAGMGALRRLVRPIAAAIVLLALGEVGGMAIHLTSWLPLMSAVVAGTSVAAALSWVGILNATQRRRIRARAATVLRSVKSPN